MRASVTSYRPSFDDAIRVGAASPVAESEVLRKIDAAWLAPVLSIVGPTASGKTALAIQIAQREAQRSKSPLLVSIDSVAVYQEMEIGTAKPSAQERQGWNWCGLDLIRPDQKMTVRKFVESVNSTISRALENEQRVILVGGSHFYERALVDGMSPGQESDPSFVASLACLDLDVLYERLVQQDARFAQKIHRNDRYRLSRYLDLTERQGLGFDQLRDERRGSLDAAVDTLLVMPDLSITYRQRVRERIRLMMESGWIEETQRLEARYGVRAPGLEAVGYAEIVRAGVTNLTHSPQLSQLQVEIEAAHWQLVRRQLSWVRSLSAKMGASK